MKSIKSRRFVLAALCLGTIALFTGCHQFSISFEPEFSEVTDTPPQMVGVADANNNNVNNAIAEIPTSQNLLTYHGALSIAGKQGKLRVSNQTNQPVRMALLAKQKTSKSSQTAKNYIPAHWDFAPQEGSEKGMVLSLPQANLGLEPGNIIVAFAQDGSRRYWGPYIVGETQYPIWNPQTQEWQFIFMP